MSSAISSAGLHISRSSTRRMVRQLHHHVAEQRQTVMECRNTAESMSAAAIAHDAHVANVENPPPFCFVEVASEKDIKQNFIPDGPLSGIAVAVSDALDVQEFHTRSGLDTPMFHHVARKEFPLISWLRRQGAQFIGKMCCRTPLALSEGTVFGPQKPSSTAVFEHACHYAISCSLNGPSSIVCAAYHDIVGFKPTAQTFGTFTERFELTMPSMTLGLSARRVDDLMYLWQVYTASIDPVAYFEQTAAKRGGSASSGANRTNTATTAGPDGANASDNVASSASSAAKHLIPPVELLGAAEARESAEDGGGHLSAGATAAAAAEAAADVAHKKSSPTLTIGNWWGGRTVLESTKHPDDTPIYARPEILDHNPYNYTVKDRRGHIADIDVGWRDYNAEAAMADDFGQPTRPGFVRRLLTGAQSFDTPQVELAVGYPAEWINTYCTGKYSSAAEFHKRITDAVYMHSALHFNQKLEIVPLAFDFTMEEVLEATTIISRYELAKAFERLFRPASVEPTPEEVAAAEVRAKEAAEEAERKAAAAAAAAKDEVAADHDADAPMELNILSGMSPLTLDAKRAASPNRPNTFSGLTGVLEELPESIVESIHAGQKLSIRDYNRALRIRDDVVRATEEQFMDVDCFLTPLLSDPYESGDMRSVRLTLPFHLAGNPILSVQVDPETPVALVGELGRDAALMEDAFCFLQFVRGASPRWWRQKVFGEGSALPIGSGKSAQPITVHHRSGAKTTPSVSLSIE
ncbi:hypothetical protein ABB37_07975 [Leptomonas pyrrhocoris]|uniref:Uncharacterized protein n=1 Tax=Leptomonas pyrrhocoris TaxID=157538 RepID=A0A0N1J4G7_LEPPY|nr:hypothetical protein ABB37_07975 [Leptomonas pyrrhocoris]KPA76228.1 hypothetical protein ABB37_07975 [Leptomonas pyrrhocoris]|eukprot:XP_015654667.1 hypothetical protein ABB37_07975 [Leptomonas pyrrhocoris]